MHVFFNLKKYRLHAFYFRYSKICIQVNQCLNQNHHSLVSLLISAPIYFDHSWCISYKVCIVTYYFYMLEYSIFRILAIASSSERGHSFSGPFRTISWDVLVLLKVVVVVCRRCSWVTNPFCCAVTFARTSNRVVL